ncbi:DNA alkylation repair protein [Kamptonema cortianum]|nr:DNA alkylation repair protein [Geitlerinema splendidum]MDK3158440.1 DNA alkylation repair protein [Kamptonema cortianum]
MTLTADDIVAQLSEMGNEGYRNVMRKHGAHEPIYGAKIGDMKPIQKQIKKDYQLAKDLYATGVYDAMYLAGLIADDTKMTQEDLQLWLDSAKSRPIANVTVAWVAAESHHGWTMGLKWIDSDDEMVVCAGWSTLSGWVALRPDSELDIPALRRLITRVEKNIHQQSTEVKYQMNGFLISVGCYVVELTEEVLAAGERIGKVDVQLIGDCGMHAINDMIQKVASRGKIGVKRKTVKC